ncbi:MAG TPA: excalibur calcium-binding domain-containing protein [Solirubrobacterales bacterium]|nr:excalibur calcium-binding domain-containing protein [Solirubrobacterales bacterium]
MAPSIRKLSLLAATATFVVLLFAALPSSAIASDKDCADFASQRAAQIFFLKHGGPRHDPDRLDADNDGVACEDNPCPCYRKKHLPHRPAVYMAEDRLLLLRI